VSRRLTRAAGPAPHHAPHSIRLHQRPRLSQRRPCNQTWTMPPPLRAGSTLEHTRRQRADCWHTDPRELICRPQHAGPPASADPGRRQQPRAPLGTNGARPCQGGREGGLGLGRARASSATPRAASFQNTSVSSPQRTTNWSRPRRSAIQACRFSCAARRARRRLSRAPALCTDARRSRGMRSAVTPAERRCAAARVRRTHARLHARAQLYCKPGLGTLCEADWTKVGRAAYRTVVRSPCAALALR